MDIEHRIRESFDRQSMMTTLGARLVTVAPGAVSIEAAIRPDLMQQHGYAHAALAFAVGDMAPLVLACMAAAMDRIGVEGDIRAFLDARFAHVADFMRNQPG